jgi:hypothetical protein
MSRFRIKIWFPDDEKILLTRFRNGDCKWCVVSHADMVTREIATVHGLSPQSAKWTVEKLTGAVDGWDIIFTSNTKVDRWIKRHGHG